MVKYKKKIKVEKEPNKKRKKIKKIKLKGLYPKFEVLINKIKQYKNPNEYTRQDQDQKLLKYMKLNPIEYIKK